MLPPSFIGDSIAHLSVGGTMMVYGVCIACNTFKEGLGWKRRKELVAFIIIGIVQLAGPLVMLINPDDCYNSVHCFQRNVTHTLAGLFVLFCVACAMFMRKFAPTVFDFAIPLAGFIPGYFLMTHDHVGETDEVEMVVASLHQASSSFMIISSVLRIAVEYNKSLELLYSISFSCIGSLLFVTSPIIVEPATLNTKFSGSNLVFLSIALVCVMHMGILGVLVYKRNRVRPVYIELSPINDVI
ncbi:MAG: hypothetical protein Harvfovirus84_3 [Harvfovirus sp.]|uniref:Uncharacterized protein n=1 Tax=Harvfovirus sp. TaxID=2487768 RepID=A0A3G5A3Z0_9VIRU|nr:MAG: hypothetical protein Harvfovirus84_3 [Harvfovirus sp.]